MIYNSKNKATRNLKEQHTIERGILKRKEVVNVNGYNLGAMHCKVMRFEPKEGSYIGKPLCKLIPASSRGNNNDISRGLV